MTTSATRSNVAPTAKAQRHRGPVFVVRLQARPGVDPIRALQLVSLWQNNLQAMRAERYFSAAVLRGDGIGVISGIVTA